MESSGTSYLHDTQFWKWATLLFWAYFGAFFSYIIAIGVIEDVLPEHVIATPIFYLAACALMLFNHNWLSGSFESRTVEELSFSRLLKDLLKGFGIGAGIFVPIVAVSALEGASFFYSRTLWMPIGLHWGWNFVQGNVFGFAVSGTDAGASIIKPVVEGPYLITGGGFGPEASVITVTLSVALTAWLIVAGIRKGNWVPMRRRKTAEQNIQQ